MIIGACHRAGASIADTVKSFRPNILLGLSTVPKIFDETVIRRLARPRAI